MGGTKRKLPMEKIEKKEARAVAFSKRREGLFSKASELCLLCDAHIAILVTPPSAKSNVSFYSFGHSSVDDVVDAFLQNRTPTISHDHALSRYRGLRKNDRLASKKPFPGLGFRWEKEGFEETANTEDLRVAIDEISELINNVKLRMNHMKNQRPRIAENLERSSVQGLSNDDRNYGTLEALVGNLERMNDMKNQRPRIADNLGHSSVQGLTNDDRNYGTLEALVGNLVRQDFHQPQKISENSDRFSEDVSTTATANSVFRFEDCGGEEVRKMEASSSSVKDSEDSLDEVDLDALFANFYSDAPPCLEDFLNF